MWPSSASASQPGLEIDILLFFEPLRLVWLLVINENLTLPFPNGARASGGTTRRGCHVSPISSREEPDLTPCIA